MPLSNWFRRAPSAAPARTGSARACSDCQVVLPEAARYCFICGQEVAPAAAAEAAFTGHDDAVVATVQARLAHALGDRYRIGGVLGKGGMGVVFLAEDRAGEGQVAIKVLRPELSADETGVARFRREAEIAASVEHPGIIPILRVGSEQGLHYFVMRYVDGCSLDALLAERKAGQRPLPVAAVARILGEAAATLAYAHRRGIVHRDVKPANIMLDEEGRVLLTDFGISKAAATSTGATTAAALTEFGTVLGTPRYLAPEQALSRTVDGRADQYALAIVGYEMLTGSVPFDDETPHGIIHRHVNELPPRVDTLRPEVPEHITAAIARALLKAPSHRFATMDDFARALDPNADRAARRWRMARRAAAALLLAGVLAAAAWMSGAGR
ncbi:MAG TPA: serine/threonine-protein kinase [Gemmatimonadaceae bacterium]|nr:serine/threonine-protein kinase [Gemmatimonadaceae bacterium]